ncbi:uncharacterized protein [Choristoneura fumiferana]|uniref:uncharacterized protein n=1 Tax=Choristoneura fumiferana TaxID=7141 RepID=UPI003D15CDFA
MHSIIYVFKPILMLQQILGIFKFRVKINDVLPTDGKLKCFGIFIVSVFVGLRSSFVKKLHDLSLAFNIIGEACSLINKLFNFHIFMVLLSIFIYILFTLWTFLYVFRTDIIKTDIVTTICWCSNKFSFVIILSFVCESLLWTRRDTKELVNELVMDYGLPASARAQAKAFMELIDAWPLRIEVYDMFAVDISLILKFISVSTTYLIFIIQISHVV